MGLKKTHKSKKSKKQVGKGMGTHGRGARKAGKDKGHKGGLGMAGSGKRADQHKSKIINMYGNDYFGKSGVTSRSTKKDKRDRINLFDIQNKYKPGEVNLESYKILGEGEIKDKFTIKAKEASKTAIEKVEKAGGKIVFPEKNQSVKETEKPAEKKTSGEKEKKEDKKESKK